MSVGLYPVGTEAVGLDGGGSSGGSPDVTVSLSGQPMAFSQGSVQPAFSAALAGLALTVSLGTITPSTGVVAALTGQAVSYAQGAVAAPHSMPLTGQSFSYAQGTLATAPVFVSEPLKRNNGTLIANKALNFVALYDDTTGALVVRKTGLSTDASGVFSFQDAALVAGTTYRVDWETVDGERRMPRKTL